MLLTADFLTEKQSTIFFHGNRILKLLKVSISRCEKNVLIFPNDFLLMESKFNLFHFFLQSGLSPSENYDRLISIEEISLESKNYFYECFKDEFIVGYELTDLTVSLLELFNIPYINIWLHPVRFMDDEMFMIKTNQKQYRDRLQQYSFPEDIFYINAEYIKIYLQNKMNGFALNKNSCVIFGQTDSDKTLRSKVGRLKLTNFQDKIVKLCSNYNNIFYSKHPLADLNPEVNEMLIDLGIEIIKENSYKILAHANLALVATISSSIGVEAYFFKKNVLFFNQPTCDCMDKNTVTCGTEIFSVPFWKNILYGETLSLQNSFLCSKNKIRNILDAYYAYGVIEK